MNSEIVVNVDIDKWIFKITKYGFIFNRKDYPLGEPKDFAEAFLKVLEKEYAVKFEKRESD